MNELLNFYNTGRDHIRNDVSETSLFILGLRLISRRHSCFEMITRGFEIAYGLLKCFSTRKAHSAASILYCAGIMSWDSENWLLLAFMAGFSRSYFVFGSW